MSKKDVYTATIVTTAKITTPAGERMQDTVQIFYDVDWKQLDFYRAKFSIAGITIEAQTRVLGKAPQVHLGERLVETELAVIPREKLAPATKPVRPTAPDFTDRAHGEFRKVSTTKPAMPAAPG